MRQTPHHQNAATDRTPISRAPRGAKRGVAALLVCALLCALLTTLSPMTVGAEALTSQKIDTSGSPAPSFVDENITTEASPESPMTRSAAQESTPATYAARSVASRARLLYAFPSGSKAVTLYLNGREVLQGHAVDIEGVAYVPVQRFAELFGSFRTTYVEATEEVTLTGHGNTIKVRAGAAYITVNDRILYAGPNAPVRSLRGWIFVPLATMTEAMGATVRIRSGYYDAFITTGNVDAVATAAEVYDSSAVYWLSRIISAEARGESLEGQIAVGNVVLNRVASREFPNSIYGVIFDKRYGTQFAPVDNGTIYNQPTASAILAAKICLEGYTVSSRALYFFNPAATAATWIVNNRPYLMDIGNHRFYG